MNNDKFKIARYVKEFILGLEEITVNYPKRYFELKGRLVNESYNLLELIYLANYTEIKNRKPIQIKALMKINMLDFYLEESFKKKIISEGQSLKMCDKLLKINKMLFKWIDDEKC